MSVIDKKRDILSDRDKSLKGDYDMRLHEFMSRKYYTPPDAEGPDRSNPNKTILRNDQPDDAKSHQTEKPTPPNTASV